MSKHLSALEELAALKAEFESRTQQIKATALSELQEQLKAAKAEVVRIEHEIAQLNGRAVQANGAHTNGADTAARRIRLKPIESGSDEWNKVAGQIAIVLKNYPLGLNGKELAYKLGLTAPNLIKRVQPVVAATARREGAGVSTKYFLNR